MDNIIYANKENVLERCGAECEKIVIIHALTRTKGDQAAAALLLGTTESALARKVHKHGIDCEQYRY
jgi:transcriptional regulator with GAF, ATPase, and Fis domain